MATSLTLVPVAPVTISPSQAARASSRWNSTTTKKPRSPSSTRSSPSTRKRRPKNRECLRRQGALPLDPAGGNDFPRTPSVPPCGLWASGVSAFESEKNEKAAPGNCRLKARGRAARDAACPVCKSLWKERDGVWGREREAFLQKSSLSLPQVSAICSIRCRCRGCPLRRNPCR